jgi:CheY-like chemotaxis protein
MRVRVCRQPTGTLDGVPFRNFVPGSVYDLGTQLANVFVAEGWAEPVEPGAASTLPPDRISALVLVVDDDTDLRQLTASILSCNGYGVIQADNGHAAIERLTHHAPDLIVLDLNMPVMDGWQFRAEQQRLEDGRLAAIPVLLVTGADGAGDHATTLKAVGLIRKPFDPESLLEAIEAALPRDITRKV